MNWGLQVTCGCESENFPQCVTVAAQCNCCRVSLLLQSLELWDHIFKLAARWLRSLVPDVSVCHEPDAETLDATLKLPSSTSSWEYLHPLEGLIPRVIHSTFVHNTPNLEAFALKRASGVCCDKVWFCWCWSDELIFIEVLLLSFSCQFTFISSVRFWLLRRSWACNQSPVHVSLLNPCEVFTTIEQSVWFKKLTKSSSSCAFSSPRAFRTLRSSWSYWTTADPWSWHCNSFTWYFTNTLVTTLDSYWAKHE